MRPDWALASAQSAVVVVVVLTSIKKNMMEVIQGGKSEREREREGGCVERGGYVSKNSNVENMERSEAALRLQYSI